MVKTLTVVHKCCDICWSIREYLLLMPLPIHLILIEPALTNIAQTFTVGKNNIDVLKMREDFWCEIFYSVYKFFIAIMCFSQSYLNIFASFFVSIFYFFHCFFSISHFNLCRSFKHLKAIAYGKVKLIAINLKSDNFRKC